MCPVQTKKFRKRALMSIDAFRIGKASNMIIPFIDTGACTLSRGLLKTIMLGTHIKFTLDQYFWYRFWKQHVSGIIHRRMNDKDKITIGKWQLTSNTITYGDIQIKPYHSFIVNRGNIAFMHEWGGHTNLSAYDNIGFLAASLALDPNHDLVY